MKRFIYKALTVIMVTLSTAVTAQANVYTWSRYNLTFETPDNGFVTYSSNTRFEVQWEDMVLTIQLYTKDKSDEQFIKDNLTRKALGFSMYDTKHGKMKVKGFKPLYIEGTMPDGSRAVICDLISNKQDLIVEITVNYLFGNREAVDDIIKSFAEGHKPKVEEKKHKQKVQSKEDSDLQEKEQKKERELQEKRRARKLFDA